MKHVYKTPVTEEEKAQRNAWAKKARAAIKPKDPTKIKKATAITLLPDHMAALKEIGNGNLSLGIRLVCDHFNLVLNKDKNNLDYLKK